MTKTWSVKLKLGKLRTDNLKSSNFFPKMLHFSRSNILDWPVLRLGETNKYIKTHSDPALTEIKFTFGELLMNVQTTGCGPRSAQKCPLPQTRINRPVHPCRPLITHELSGSPPNTLYLSSSQKDLDFTAYQPWLFVYKICFKNIN